MRINIKFVLLLIIYPLLTVPAYSYSIFSSAGLGEPVDILDARIRGMGGVFKLETYKELTIECAMLFENVDVDGKANFFDFTLPYFKFLLPLPKSTGIDVTLKELLNLNFDIKTEWHEAAGDSVQRRVKGRGSASIVSIGICKLFTPLFIEAGGFMVFGSSMEEWVTDFKHMHDAYDTVNLRFLGKGLMSSLLLEVGKFFDINAEYFSSSALTTENRLPHRFKLSLFIRPVDKIRLGTGITHWLWEAPFKPMHRLSVGGEVDLTGRALPIVPTLRAGFYTGNWYYEIYEYGNVQEKVGSLGAGVLFKSLCRVDLAVEFGKRSNSIFEEKIYRLCLTIQGKEIL